jgi:hypothetical protein
LEGCRTGADGADAGVSQTFYDPAYPRKEVKIARKFRAVDGAGVERSVRKGDVVLVKVVAP